MDKDTITVELNCNEAVAVLKAILHYQAYLTSQAPDEDMIGSVETLLAMQSVAAQMKPQLAMRAQEARENRNRMN